LVLLVFYRLGAQLLLHNSLGQLLLVHVVEVFAANQVLLLVQSAQIRNFLPLLEFFAKSLLYFLGRVDLTIELHLELFDVLSFLLLNVFLSISNFVQLLLAFGEKLGFHLVLLLLAFTGLLQRLQMVKKFLVRPIVD